MSEEVDSEDVPPSNDASVPAWLKLTYLVLPIWGLIFLWYFFNGTHGWLDRGAWQALQQAAKTTTFNP